MVVHFGVHHSQGAVIRLAEPDGQPVAVGGKAKLVGASGPAVPIGYDGEVFITALAPHNQLDVTRANGKACVARFDYRAGGDDMLPTIGPVACTDQ